jgi:hypothetical protein
VVGGVLASLVLSGCATGGGTAGQGSPTPRADLAGPAEVAAKNLNQRPVGARKGRPRAHHERTPGTGRTRTAKQAAGSGSAPTDAVPVGSSGSAGAAEAPGPWHPVRLAADAHGDHGDGPPYADLVSLTLEDDGTSLRIGIELAGTVPGRLADGEVQGVGVDLFRTREDESDFQVFLDGGSDGWRGYLQTPRGFVRYPGTLSVDGRMLVTVIPWASLGGRSGAQASAFADWSDDGGRSSADAVDRGPLQLG